MRRPGSESDVLWTAADLFDLYGIVERFHRRQAGGARARYYAARKNSGGDDAAKRGAALALEIAMNAAMVAGMVAQFAAIVGTAEEASNPMNSPAMSAALGMSAGMMATQMASDLVAIAMGALMGKDPCIPPGTFGAIALNTSDDVMIGGFPMPSWMTIAQGLLKMIGGLRGRSEGEEGRAASGANH